MKDFFKNFKYIWKYTKGNRSKLTIYVILDALLVLIGLIVPYLSAKRLVELTNSNFEKCYTLLL